MSRIDPTVKKETGYIAGWVLLLSAVMELVFLLTGHMDYTVPLGNLLGGVAAILNFFLMGWTIQRAVGLDENTEYEQLDARIRQVKLLGDLLDDYGVPYQRPAGGHAIFVDAKKVLPNLPKEQFIAQTLAVELYLEAGIRGVEIGSILADRDPDTHENRYPRLELLRLAIPRRVYSDNHIRVIAAACRNIYERRAEITTGYRITFEAPILRHFTVELDKI